LIHELILAIGGLRDYSMIGIIYEHSLLVLLHLVKFIVVLYPKLTFVDLCCNILQRKSVIVKLWESVFVVK
jgi:hypothetical protein